MVFFTDSRLVGIASIQVWSLQQHVASSGGTCPLCSLCELLGVHLKCEWCPLQLYHILALGASIFFSPE